MTDPPLAVVRLVTVPVSVTVRPGSMEPSRPSTSSRMSAASWLLGGAPPPRLVLTADEWGLPTTSYSQVQGGFSGGAGGWHWPAICTGPPMQSTAVDTPW